MLAAVALPDRAGAQGAGWNGRVRIGINGGAQTGGGTLQQAFTLRKNLESTPVTADTAAAGDSWFDAGIVVRLKRRFGVGVAVSHARREGTADVSAQVPHPFFFDQSRTVAGTVPAIRNETTMYVGAVWMLPFRKVDLMLSAGPSLFHASRTLITDVLYSDAYPYDTATFGSAPATRVERNAAGFHLGADLTVKLSAQVGIGGLLRFSRASAAFTAAADNASTARLGGLQAGGGLRVGF
jgi:hypothetical protein